MRELLKNHLRPLKRHLRAMVEGTRRKAVTLVSGESPVSLSCQIPNIRALYREIGLPPRTGTFVEVGGFDGERFSNTSFLADQGWRGVYVEPVPEFCTTIRVRHFFNKVAIEPVAVSTTPGSITLYVMGSLTSASEETKQAYKSIDWSRSAEQQATPIEVKTETIESIFKRNAISHEFDLMVIDVEGGEEPIVHNLVASSWRPRVLIVELIDLHPDFAAFPTLQDASRRSRRALLQAGYEQRYADAINSVFVYRDRRAAA